MKFKEITIADIGYTTTGKTPPGALSRAFSSRGIPFITPRDLKGERYISDTERFLSREGVMSVSKNIVPKGSVLVSCIGSDLGKAALTTSESVTNQQINTIVVENCDVDTMYLYYCLRSRQEFFKKIAGGSATPILNKRDFEKTTITFPPIDYQRSSSRWLDSLDKKIELNQKTNQTLEQIAQAIFKSWFVDFDPVIDNALEQGKPLPDALAKRAEQRKAVRAQQAKGELPSLPKDLRQRFPSEFVFSDELGWVPKGWDVSNVGDVVDVVGGGTPSTKNNDYWTGGIYNFCAPKDMSALKGNFVFSTNRKLTESGIGKISSGLLPVDTVLMSSRAPIGYLCINKEPVAINQGVIALKPNPEFSAEFLLEWLRVNIAQVKNKANGSTFLEIGKSNFRSIEFLIPSTDTLEAYNDLVKPLFLKSEVIEKSSKVLEELRDTLLPKLISGELRIPDAEKLAADAGL